MTDLNLLAAKRPIRLADKLMNTCKHLNSIGLDAKKFVQGMLTSTDPDVAKRRWSWGIDNGWVSTCEVLNGFKRLIDKDRRGDGKDRWASFILQEVRTKCYERSM